MKVLLINPPNHNEIIGNNPPVIEEERGYNPPLGLLYLAGYLEQHSQHQVEVLDCQVSEIGYERLRELVAERQPEVVGVTVMTFTILDVIKTVGLVKEAAPSARVVLGGPHAHIFPRETISLPGVDYLVRGEGEIPFFELVEHLDDHRYLARVPGLVFMREGQVVDTGTPPLNTHLDELPFPSRHLTPYQKYSSVLASRNPVTTMITSRGCPFKCIFCDRPHLGKRFRARSANNVVDEMQLCAEMGIRYFLIYDDTFTINRQRVLDICAEIRRRRLDIAWDIRARVDTIDRDILGALASAGCQGIHYGVEAGSDRILKVLGKGITLQQVREAFRLTKQAGISTLAYFMIGAPSETREDILQTINLACELDPDLVHMTILTPFPATSLYFRGLEEGFIDRDYWREFAANPTADFQPPYWEENLTRDELIDLIDLAYKKFYTRPRYVIRQVLKVRSWREFRRKAAAGLKVLRSGARRRQHERQGRDRS